ncbi:hypothetical protein Q3G72_032533 [Acer saccharum]|nr:hypothetical protein Q3G72_032533 [Acer saccharum]
MGSEAELEQSSTLKLPLFSMTSTMESPERPGMLTPPLHTSVSVPFRWEEEPGKPKPCTALITYSDPKSNSDFAHKCLELPPRLLSMDANSSSKLSSPTTVLEGPYYVGRPRFQGSSFRMSGECYGSFRKSLSPERDHHEDQLGALMLKRSSLGHKERGGVFGSLRRRGVLNLKGNKREVGGGSYVFPSYVDRDSEFSRESEEGNCSTSEQIKRAGSFSTLPVSVSKSHFWATIYGGLKQVVPWKNKKAKKEGLLS